MANSDDVGTRLAPYALKFPYAALLSTLGAVLLVLFTTQMATGQSYDGTYGDFYLIEGQDDFTDEDRSFIMTTKEGEEGALAWKCRRDGLNVVLLLGGYMGGDDDGEIRVRYRFDNREPSSYQQWGLFQDQEIAYLPMHRVAQFTETAKSSDTIVMEAVDPLDGEARRYNFSLDGFIRAILQLSCAHE